VGRTPVEHTVVKLMAVEPTVVAPMAVEPTVMPRVSMWVEAMLALYITVVPKEGLSTQAACMEAAFMVADTVVSWTLPSVSCPVLAQVTAMWAAAAAVHPMGPGSWSVQVWAQDTG